jgi:hypothetical protein
VNRINHPLTQHLSEGHPPRCPNSSAPRNGGACLLEESRKLSNPNSNDGRRRLDLARPLAFLSPRQICMIDELLERLGDFGEVRLIVQKGKLRFVSSAKSYDVYKWEDKGEEEE